MAKRESKGLRASAFLAITVIILILDQALKAWVRNNLRPGESWPRGPIPGYFEITLTYNRGVAFGALEGYSLLAVPIALIITGLCIWSVVKPNTTGIKVWALSLLASGAIGNLIDRVVDRRGVTDMFLVRLANMTGGRINDFPVFNIADVAITFSVILLAIIWMREAADEKKVVSEKVQFKEGDPAESADSSDSGD